MRLIEELEARIAKETGLFQAQLLREDLARLRRVRELAAGSADRETFVAAARRLSWTANDQRTPELHAVLQPLLDEVYELERGNRSEEGEARLRQAWLDLTRVRMETLVGCLTTRVPKPEA